MLEKWKRECAYCGAKDTRLEIEHIQPRCKGGSNSITNLTLACHKCNQKKGEKDIKVFLHPNLKDLPGKPLLIKACGHGSRQMCRTDKFGFPSRHVPQFKFVKGFQTGDIVKAVVTTGKKTGTYNGRVAVRSTGSFNISTATGLVQGISYKFCSPIHRKDGYGYSD